MICTKKGRSVCLRGLSPEMSSAIKEGTNYASSAQTWKAASQKQSGILQTLILSFPVLHTPQVWNSVPMKLLSSHLSRAVASELVRTSLSCYEQSSPYEAYNSHHKKRRGRSGPLLPLLCTQGLIYCRLQSKGLFPLTSVSFGSGLQSC